jgi:prophage tail gpP-like protein
MEIILKVDRKEITDFDVATVELRYDTIASTFSFEYRRDDKIENLRALNKISKYAECTVTYNGERMITGTILNNGLADSLVKTMSSISGYSTTGVLEDCQIPVSLYPLQTDGLSLIQIAQRLTKPFNIRVSVDPQANAAASRVIESTTAEIGDTIKGYLSKLASQRNLVLSHDSSGNLLITKFSAVNNNKFSFTGGPPATNYTLRFNGKGMHSEITVVKQADSDGGNAGQSTVKNPYVPIFRPAVYTQSSGNDNDTATAARSALQDELRAVTLDINVNSWVNWDGRLWRPGQLITVRNAEIGLPNLELFFIEGVVFTDDSENGKTAVLNCVLPQVYDSESRIRNIFA